MKKVNEEWVWWKHGVIYHIYPLSFQDSNGDGAGDIPGIIRKLGYLADLGITAIWLSPVFVSPMMDFGYDVSDYHNIDPLFGTLDDLTKLICESHSRGIRVILDLVMNHTSHLHDWFRDSRSSRDSIRRDWYIWKDGKKGKPPNNWKSVVGGSAWQYDEHTQQYYLHSFFKEEPDLNWRNKDMQKVFFEEIRFWLDLGVDGFRLDVINMIIKDKKFRNNPVFLGIPWMQKHRYTRNRPKSLKLTKMLRKLLDEYNDRMCVGEIYALPPGNPEGAAGYLSTGNDSLHLAFDFSLIFTRWNARKYYKSIENWYSRIPPEGWACNVLSNHDLFRSINRFGSGNYKLQKARVAAVLLLTLRGTPFIYYGEEIGMENAKLNRKDIRDPLGKRFYPFFRGRDRARTPMQWTNQSQAGFTSGTPWLPVSKNYPEQNIERQLALPGSLLNLYKQLIHCRNGHRSLQSGNWIPLIKGTNGILAYLRVYHEEKTLVLLNFKGKSGTQNLDFEQPGIVLASTHRKENSSLRLSEYHFFPFEATVFKLGS